MHHKPTRENGQAKLQRWAEERRERRHFGSTTSENVHPRGNGDRDERDVARSIERIEALLGR
jgi:hypothetical protein